MIKNERRKNQKEIMNKRKISVNNRKCRNVEKQEREQSTATKKRNGKEKVNTGQKN